MKSNRWKEIITFLLIILFAYTATSKFLDYYRFVFQMRLAPFPLIKMFAPAIGWIMPLLEWMLVIALGIGIIYPRRLLRPLWMSLFLFLLFEVYISVMLLSGLRLPCTCGGVISEMSWSGHLIFNAVFLLLNGIALWLHKKDIQHDLSSEKR
ncbi:MauE/DoxX family redox-associated membrane protein [Mucilaginibacter sp. BT774]|uniref:MauE/DoxX family redox-associated membrane protein n=1 Tax=Mucilaginibacter sp. BT774 TaxID=3062276 RepID=UPI0026768849|nr:MauE/DoxX family redox-associated membrane protein [Mucilaginibacter sp. BT774]MDO3627561.1 hypothetical protein [Mucilaginibacter sp. BT774]